MRITCGLLFIFIFHSCLEDSSRKNGLSSSEYLNNIKELIDSGDTYAAKFKIDSIDYYYPLDSVAKMKGSSFVKQMNVDQKKRDLAYIDSLMIENKQAIDKILPLFIYEPSQVAGLPGRYISKDQTIEKKIKSSYIRGNVKDDGSFYISSHYYSNIHIDHTQIKVNSGELFVKSSIVPLGGGFNMKYNDGLGHIFEVVIYNKDSDGGIFSFIADHAKDRLKVQFIGKRNVTITLSDKDKNAILKSNQLSQLIINQKELKKEREKISFFLGSVN